MLPRLDRPIKPRSSSSILPDELLYDAADDDDEVFDFERIANVYSSSGQVKSLLRVSSNISVRCSKPAFSHVRSLFDSKSTG